MDRIIFGDNQFFGINHMSEDKAQAQSERFKDISSIIEVIDFAYQAGIRTFMFTTHEKVKKICDHFRSNPEHYSEIQICAALPYPHKYANAVNEKGMIGGFNDIVFSNPSAKQLFGVLVHGSLSIIKQNMIDLMKFLVDIEMATFHNLNVRAIFLQNIVTDLLLGFGVKEIFIEYAKYIKNKYGIDPGFITMNLPALAAFLFECGIENPIICSSINKRGYLMNPDRAACEEVINSGKCRNIAMSILASGAVEPHEAVEYVQSFENIQSIIFGASTLSHIRQTRDLIEKIWAAREAQ